MTRLMMAALDANLDAMQRMIEQGARINATDDDGTTPLMWAVRGGDVTAVNLLVAHGADIDATAVRGLTALKIGMFAGNEQISSRLVAAGASLSGEFNDKQSYLEFAAANGYASLVQALVERSTELETSGSDALCLAIDQQHVEVVRTLIEAGVDVNRQGSDRNDLPIIHAVRKPNQNPTRSPKRMIIELLIDAGARVESADKTGTASVIEYAVQFAQPEVVAYLLGAGASFNADDGRALLSSAIQTGSPTTARLLIAEGAEISRNHLAEALAGQNLEIVDTLAERLDFESMDDYSLDQLTGAALAANHQPTINKLLEVVETRDRPEKLRLLFKTSTADGCALHTWNPFNTVKTSMVLDDLPCNALLFTARTYRTVFALAGKQINVHSIDNTFETYSLPKPTQAIDVWLEEVHKSFRKHPGIDNPVPNANVVTIGYLTNGQISIIAHTIGPGDGIYAAQFVRIGDTWIRTKTKNCHRFDDGCHIPDVDGRGIWDEPQRRTILHPMIKQSAFFVAREFDRYWQSQDNTGRGSLVFDIRGKRTEIDYIVRFSGHCFDDCHSIQSITIKPENTKPIEIDLGWNNVTSIADQYILVQPVSGGARVYDLASGKEVVDQVRVATWVY